MKKAIWKFPINSIGVNKIMMPMDAVILTLQTQGNMPCMWALCDPSKTEVERTFEPFSTGETFNPSNMSYIGTFQIHNGALVFHLFEIVKK